MVQGARYFPRFPGGHRGTGARGGDRGQHLPRERSERGRTHIEVKGEAMDTVSWTFSDTIAGYVSSCDAGQRTFGLKTTDGREFQVHLTAATYGEVLRNLGEPFQDPGAPLESLMTPGRHLFAYGIFY